MLTDNAIKNFKPAKKPIRNFDSNGLYIEVSPSGGKWWRLKYRFQGKEKRLSLGVYPEISLKKARELRDEFRKMVAEGLDPSENRKTQKNSQIESGNNTFESIAREWIVKHGRNWVASHADRTMRRLDRDVFPWIGKKPISNITGMKFWFVFKELKIGVH